MNRRGFLKSLFAAAVSVPLAPAAIVSLTQAAPKFETITLTARNLTCIINVPNALLLDCGDRIACQIEHDILHYSLVSEIPQITS